MSLSSVGTFDLSSMHWGTWHGDLQTSPDTGFP